MATILGGCGGGGAVPEVLGEVNREYLTTDEFLYQFALRGGPAMEGRARKAFKRALLAELVDRKLLLQECRRRRIRPERRGYRQAMRALGAEGTSGWDREDPRMRWQVEDDAWDRAAIEELAAREFREGAPPARAEAEGWLAAHPDALTAPPRLRLRLIVVRSAAMRTTVARALEGGVAFEDAARRWSQAPEARDGGLLGWRREDELPPDLWAAARASGPAGSTAAVDTPYGPVFVRVEGRDPGGAVPRAEAREHARKAIAADRRRAALDAFVTRLRREARLRLDLKALDRL